MIRLYLTCILLLPFSSCKHTTFETKIADQIKNSCLEKSECIIDIKNLTPFTWDKMHVFKYNTTLDDIHKVVGVYTGKYSEFSRRIVFTSNDRIVFSEEYSENIEALTEGEIVFDIPDSLRYKSYDIDKAIFTGEIQQSGNTTYYKLTQVKQKK